MKKNDSNDSYKSNYLGVHDRLYDRIAKGERDGWSSEDDVANMIKYFRRALAETDFQPRGHLLELGCGDGCFTTAVAQSFPFKCSGLDIVSQAIDMAKKRAVKAGIQLDLRVGDVLDLPWPDDFFDVIVDGHCFHCIVFDDRKRFLNEAKRVLKSGGLFVVMTMAGDPPNVVAPYFDTETRCEVIKNVAVRYYGLSNKILEEIRESGFEVLTHWVVAKQDEADTDELIVAGRPQEEIAR